MMVEKGAMGDENLLLESFLGPEKDIFFMNKALALAKRAMAQDEVPIGAVVVDARGVIVGRGFNQVERRHCQTAHAEIMAIEKAAQKMGNWRLEGCWLYVTLQPCAMCMGLIRLSRMAGVVYAAKSPLFGYHLDNDLTSSVYKRDILAIIHSICERKAVDLLQSFFQKKRKKQ